MNIVSNAGSSLNNKYNMSEFRNPSNIGSQEDITTNSEIKDELYDTGYKRGKQLYKEYDSLDQVLVSGDFYQESDFIMNYDCETTKEKQKEQLLEGVKDGYNHTEEEVKEAFSPL